MKIDDLHFKTEPPLGFEIVNGVEKNLNETTVTIEDEKRRALGKPVTEARPRMKSTKR